MELSLQCLTLGPCPKECYRKHHHSQVTPSPGRIWVFLREPQEETCPAMAKVLRCFREEKMLFAFVNFIKKKTDWATICRVAALQFTKTPPCRYRLFSFFRLVLTPWDFCRSSVRKSKEPYSLSWMCSSGRERVKRLIADCKRSGEWGASLQKCHTS